MPSTLRTNCGIRYDWRHPSYPPPFAYPSSRFLIPPLLIQRRRARSFSVNIRLRSLLFRRAPSRNSSFTPRSRARFQNVIVDAMKSNCALGKKNLKNLKYHFNEINCYIIFYVIKIKHKYNRTICISLLFDISHVRISIKMS